MLRELLFAAALSTAPSTAVHPDERAAYEAMLRKQALDADAVFAGSPCGSATVEHVSTVVVKVADQPDLQALLERLRVTGCGRSAVENIHVGRFGGSQPWRMVTALPGESLADMSLQQSAWPSAIAQARVELAQDCQNFKLGEIYVTAREGQVDVPPIGAPIPKPVAGRFVMQLPENMEAQRQALDVSKAWAEVWPIELCGHDRTTAVVFIPLRDGAHSLYLFAPVWRQALGRDAGALPAPAPGH